jgi:hypothetical protein
MNEAPEDLHHRLDQLRLLATETTDPLAERLVRDMILRTTLSLNARATPGIGQFRSGASLVGLRMPAPAEYHSIRMTWP